MDAVLELAADVVPKNQLWPDKRRAEAQRLVNWLLAQKVPGGWPVGQDFDVALIELAESSTQPLSRTAIWRLVDALSKTDDQTGKTIEELERLWSAGRNAPPVQALEWRFWLPLELDPREPIQLPVVVTMLDTTFTLAAGTDVRSQLAEELGKLPEYRGLENRSVRAPTFITFTGRGDHWLSAWRTAEPAWDAYRGLAAFTFGRGQYRLFGHGPRSVVLHPEWMLSRADSVPLQFHPFAVDYDPNRRMSGEVAISPEKMQRFTERAVPFAAQPPENSTLAVLATCFRLWAQAMDTGQDHSCFLGLWQLAEAITVAEEKGGKTKCVAGRMGMFLNFAPVGGNRTLHYLARRRNKMVHEGILAMEPEDLNLIQFACESALGWLLATHAKLPTQFHLREFYRCYSLGDSQVAAIAETVARLQESREIMKKSPR
jgi:hypothetical protein